MKTYAYVYLGVVREIIPPLVIDGVDIPIEERYHPDFVAQCVDITDLSPQPAEWWLYDGETFSPPEPTTE